LQGSRRGHVLLRPRDGFVVHLHKLHENIVGVWVGPVGARGNGPGDELRDELEDAALGVPVGLN
jgi:hypothetical protein